MKKIYLLLLSLFASAALQAAELDQTARLYNRACSACHGKQGDKAAMGESKKINSLSAEEIVSALKERREGRIDGRGNPAKKRLNEADLQPLAEYVAGLK